MFLLSSSYFLLRGALVRLDSWASCWLPAPVLALFFRFLFGFFLSFSTVPGRLPRLSGSRGVFKNGSDVFAALLTEAAHEKRTKTAKL